MQIGKRHIGPGHPCYVIAELSANHAGSFEKAVALVRAAKESGADAVKLQTYTADTMTIDCDSHYFRIKGGLWDGRDLYSLYKQASTPWDWHKPLQEEAHRLGLDLFSSPFDETAVDFLETLNVPAYKIASFEMVDDPLLVRVAQTKKPVIVSTGMATQEEITHALDVLRGHGCHDIALLKCVSAYPAKPQDMHLRTMADMRERFGCLVGLSDHTTGIVIPVAAVVLGANIIEKHVMLDKTDQSLDAAFSLIPSQFREMADAIRTAECAQGQVQYQQTTSEKESVVFRRSIFVVEDIKKGETFTRANVRVIRPGYGLSPKHYTEVLNQRAAVDLKRGTPLTRDMIHA